MKPLKRVITQMLAAGALFFGAANALADANPTIPFWGGGGSITANPHYPIVGENTHLTIVVGNTGDAPAENVQVRIAYNDWGVTFQGWQEIATVTIPSIPPGGTATAEADYIFQNRAHTCLEAVIVGANENGNPDDDRGQINLEVINAGETFTYWVPVRNNGDDPLQLLLVGGCQGGRPQEGVDRPPCDQKEQIVEVEPGEELLIPVQIDLRNVPPGGEVVFILDAYDLGAENPFAAQNRNHVELRIRKQTARGLKEQALSMLNAAAAQTTAKNLRNQIENAAGHVDKALTTKNWVSGNEIKKAGGASVFAQEEAALNKLVQLLSSGLPAGLKADVDQAARLLVDADRILTETANRAAGGAEQETINEGDEERAAGNYAEAVNKYKNAWQNSVD